MAEQGINSWPEDDRPRERLLRYGEHKLTDTELLAVILGSGVKGKSAIDLARAILKQFGVFRDMADVDFSRWKEFKGLGAAKIARIKAAIEIGRRFKEQGADRSSLKIRSSKDIADILTPRMGSLKKEVVKAVFLNSQSRITDIVEIAEGTVNNVRPLIREVFHKALQHYAAAIICVHNHPSGHVNPSSEDKKFTSGLAQSGAALQIMVLDHIIIGKDAYFSFADKGML
ncbi:MAG: DNA repair protein RadC [Candidatus Omnitrophica bacterium]|nr:DNA repair protein RadC [Candidatus Omnitrophota bacterium]